MNGPASMWLIVAAGRLLAALFGSGTVIAILLTADGVVLIKSSMLFAVIEKPPKAIVGICADTFAIRPVGVMMKMPVDTLTVTSVVEPSPRLSCTLCSTTAITLAPLSVIGAK